MKRLILYVISIVFTANIYGSKLIVNPDGSGDYTTIQSAANVAKAGDTIFIFPGTYFETVYTINSGMADEPIVYLGSDDGEVIIDGEHASREFCIRILGNSNLEFKNIKVKGAYWYGIDFQGPATNVVFDNVAITENIHPTEDWSYGLVINGASGNINNVVIRNCEIYQNRAHGLYILNEVHDVLIENCHIHHNGLTAEDVADNIIIADWDNEENGPKRIEIRNCEINNSMRQGISTWFARNLWIHDCHFHHNGATAVQIEDGVENFIVENCVLEKNQLFYSTETGVWVDDAKNGIVRNNVIRENQVGIKVSKSENVIIRHNLVHRNNLENDEFSENGGIFFLAYDGVDNKNIAVVHNTFFDVGNPSPDFLNAMVMFYEYGSANIEGIHIYNNIFSNITNGYYLGLYTSNGTDIDYNSDYNLIYDDEDLRTFSQNDLVNWNSYLSNSGQESNSIFEYPEFIDTLNNDFRIDDTSPCYDKGKFLTQTGDAGIGKEVVVSNALFFNDGYGITTGDSIKIGTNDVVIIEDVDYVNNTITINESISWKQNDNVSFKYRENTPDIGAIEGPGKATSFSKIETDEISGLYLKIYPNPIIENSSIQFKSAQNEVVTIEIINSIGEVVFNRKYKALANKNNVINDLRFGDLQNGYYIVRLTSSVNSITEKVVKI